MLNRFLRIPTLTSSMPPIMGSKKDIEVTESILAARCEHDQIEKKDNVIKCLRCPLAWKSI